MAIGGVGAPPPADWRRLGGPPGPRRGGGGRTATPGRAGPSRAPEPPVPGLQSEPEPRCRRHALGPRAAEECVPGRGTQVHRALQQVLSVPAVHEAVSGLRYVVDRGRLSAGTCGSLSGANAGVPSRKDKRGEERP